MVLVTDAEVMTFIGDKKVIPKDFNPKFKEGEGKVSFEHEVIAESGNTYKIIIRRSKINPMDFSVIFGIHLGGNLFRIKRYNGNSHIHINRLEKMQIAGFYIHTATQRYQECGFREEGYAEATTKYHDWISAMNLMLKENNFEFELDKAQKRLG